jgi:hypothetical protein
MSLLPDLASLPVNDFVDASVANTRFWLPATKASDILARHKLKPVSRRCQLGVFEHI